ncbi:hypothetical protein N9Y42_04600 [Mariniblastus sp.]|nr:hypothetical protein [Mariniblastus sp.]
MPRPPIQIESISKLFTLNRIKQRPWCTSTSKDQHVKMKHDQER